MLTFRCDSNAAHTPKRILADQLSKQRHTRKTLPEHTEVVLLEAPGERSSIRPSPDRQVSLWVYECCVTKIANHAGAGISENNRGSRLVCKPVQQVSPLVFLSSASILAGYKQWRHFAGNLITGGKCFRLPVFHLFFHTNFAQSHFIGTFRKKNRDLCINYVYIRSSQPQSNLNVIIKPGGIICAIWDTANLSYFIREKL